MITKEHQHHISKIVFLRSKLGRMYVHLIIQSFAASMISVFIPIFLLVNGFSLVQVFLYLIVQWSVFSLVSPVSASVISRIGLKEVIIVRTLVFIVALVFLSVIDSATLDLVPYLFVAVLLAVSSNLYSLSVTSLYTSLMHKSKSGSETSKFYYLPQLGTVLGPLVGGAISVLFGFKVLFVCASIALFCSVLPLSFLSHRLDHPKFSFREYVGFFREYWRLSFAIGLYGARAVASFLFVPISVYLLGGSITELSVVIALAAGAKVSLSLWYGKRLDKSRLTPALRWGAVLAAGFIAILGLSVDSRVFVYVAASMGFVVVFSNLPVEAKIYERAKRQKHILSFIAFKESSFLIGRVGMLLLAILFVGSFEMAYYIAAITSILFILVWK